ncbi:beta-alanine-activating enzyme [Lampris incognitus]|uniref:beta-alanine-activating enzyme n=1 Tax=Lampris incognitus TaxID=2546036 RepID=UPI0024B5310D|nr:beta-alanine-activating enzyme [Lampris incognitus]
MNIVKNQKMLQDIVAKSASLDSARVAVTFESGSGHSVSLSYGEVFALRDDLSHNLRRHCLRNDGVIALYCDTDLYLPVWILGILQLPAAYAVLDPEAPGRLSVRVMSQCDIKYCAVQTKLLERFQTAFSKLITMEVCAVLTEYNLTLIQVQLLPPAVHDHEGAEQQRNQNLDDAGLSSSAIQAEDIGHRDLAYVLHTSGTTGLPKIVRVPHKCIVPNILHLRTLFQMSAEDVVFLASPLTFDPSVVEIFLALSSGAQLLIVPTVIKKMPNRLAQLLFKNHRTTVLQVTPTLLRRFGRHILNREVLSAGSSLRVLALGGEACPSPALIKSWKQEGNKTHIYNIYGITEVSCWASCYQIPESVLQSNEPFPLCIPLGSPLMGTTLEVRDEQGCIVTEGEGQVFLGGKDRVCLLDDESAAVPGTMRVTGDWVKVKDKHLYYLGRRDRLIKRHGQRVNLDNLQQVIMSLPEVESCAVGLYEGSWLVAFVVATTSGDQKATFMFPSVHQHKNQSPPASADNQEDLTSSIGHHEERYTSNNDPQKAILHHLNLLVPGYSVPDTLVLVPALPLSSHGKVDASALMKIYQRQRERLASDNSLRNEAELKQKLKSLWQDALGLAKDAAVEGESHFLFSGGDSLKALRLYDDIITAVGTALPGLLEVILDGNFLAVLNHVTRATMTLPFENSSTSPSDGKKRQADPLCEVLAKRERTETSCTADAQKQEEIGVSSETMAVKVIRRAGEVTDKGPSLTVRTSGRRFSNGNSPSGETGSPRLDLSWSSDTGRCVDASPVLLVQGRADQRPGLTKTTVFIGSHSHRMQALDLATGELLWERVLGNRIESSAAVTRCGTLVVVGCYDGCVYFLCAASGETRWVFQTGDAVKSCPTVDPLTGLVIVGSHDGHVYALNPQVCQCAWRQHCEGGAVFSSPYLDLIYRRLYVASLGGLLLCLNPDNGDVLWTYSRGTPFFSSPNGANGQVVIGSVDGNICCFSNTGKLLWEFLTKGPVFSSPTYTPDQQRVFCGSHDGLLYCLNCTDGSLIWSFQTSAKVYSSPCTLSGSTVGRRGILVGTASTDGTIWILDGQEGTLVSSLTLPGELFSSPVVWKHSLVVGCRNDFVYCIKLTDKRERQRNS